VMTWFWLAGQSCVMV